MAQTPDVVANALIQSAWGNEIRDRTVQSFATVTERNTWAAPPKGALAVTLDSLSLWQYDGTAWVPAGPNGVVGYAELTAGFAYSTSPIDIPGLSVTFTAAGGGRRYRISAEMWVQTTVTNDRIGFQICTPGTTVVAQGGQVAVANQGITVTRSAVITPAAGPVTAKIRGVRFAGTGSVSMVAGTNDPAFILAEAL